MAGLTYAVDLVLCIDSTGSMDPVIDRCKGSALRFHEDLKRAMEEKQKSIGALRVRIISYRDVVADGPDWIRASQFFRLPDEAAEFSDFIANIEAAGGGDEPESSLEALTLAIRSDWTSEGDRRRHIIVLWTDASAHRLETMAELQPRLYPPEMPRSLMELTGLWHGQEMSPTAKRLLLYAPDAYPWSEVAAEWENTVHVASRAGEGLQDVQYGEVLRMIAASV